LNQQDNKPRGETDLCRNRLLKYCRGQGLDLGCGNVKIKSEAIGIDLLSPFADMKVDARLMPFYEDELFDYIFSSHLLEEIQDTEATLREWLRILKKGGHIVLYQADQDYYHPLDDPRCNQKHIHHFTWKELWEIFENIGGIELIHHARYSEDPYKEWSFELVIQKKGHEKEAINGNEGISILIPTLNRPQNIENFTTSVDKNTSEPDKVEIVFGIHKEDKLSAEKIEEIKDKVKITVRPVFITRYKDNRIHLSHLWNQIYEKAKYPIVGYFGDDVLFHTEGWDQEIRDEFKKDKTVMVCCNDVHIQKGKAATLFFTHKTVHDKFGFYLPMKFRRWYADTYWDVIFRNAGKYHYREDIVTEHLHPDVFKENKDSVYKAMETFKAADKKIWMSEENKKELYKHIEALKKNFTNIKTPILSILICTLPKRAKMLEDLINSLNDSVKYNVEILYDNTVNITTGEKRNNLIHKAKGKYISFIDDDDKVSKNYIKRITEIAISIKPDVIGLTGIMTTNGSTPKKFKHSLQYDGWYEKNEIFYRYPNHLNPIKKDIALKILYPEKTIAEDRDYSHRLYKYLKENNCTEFYIDDEPMYYYLYTTKK